MAQKDCTGYRFDVFEVQLGSERLLRKDQVVRVQQLPFQMLVVLLERAGEPVSHDELRSRLWSDQTFLEFDNNLRVAMAKLREALGDQAAEPRFVKTIARKGYQFVGQAVPLFEAPVVESSAAEWAEPVAPPTRPASLLRRIHVPWVLSVLASGLALAGAGYWYSVRPLDLGNEKVTLGDIANHTGDAAFDGALSTAFRFKIQESPYLNLVQEQDFRRLVRAGSSDTPQASDLNACRTLGASVFVNGRIQGSVPDYRIELDAWRCKDGRRLETVDAPAASQADVLPALDQAIERMRRRLGEPESSIVKYTAPLTQTTTSSLLALKSLTLGDDRVGRGQVLPAISDYKLAIDLDPEFALAYARMGAAYNNAKEYSAARVAFQKAFALRERTTDRERLYITAHYYSAVTGELPRETEAYQLWQTVYPRDVIPVQNLINIYLSLGQVDKALQMARTAQEIAPFSPVVRALLARAYLGNGQYAELNKSCGDPSQAKTDMVLFHTTCFLAASVQKDEAGAQRELQWAHGNPQESVMLEYAALVEVSQGRLAAARHTFDHARKSADLNHLVDFGAELDLDEAGLEAEVGSANAARALTLDALRQAPETPSVHASAALAFARIGDIGRAEAEALKAAAQVPPTSTRNTTLMLSAHAAIELDRHNAGAAVRLLEDVRPYDDVAYMALSPAYYRGLALLEDGRLDDAAMAYRQVIGHRVLYPESAYGELARLQLGHTLQLRGDTASAAAQYRELETTWNTADPDFAPLNELHRYEAQIHKRR